MITVQELKVASNFTVIVSLSFSNAQVEKMLLSLVSHILFAILAPQHVIPQFTSNLQILYATWLVRLS